MQQKAGEGDLQGLLVRAADRKTQVAADAAVLFQGGHMVQVNQVPVMTADKIIRKAAFYFIELSIKI